MANERRPKSASEILDTLHTLSLDTEEEILAMSRDQVRAGLAEEGIDLGSAKVALAKRLKEIRAQHRLAEARERRLAQESALSTRQEPVQGKAVLPSMEQIRSEVERRLGLLLPAKTPLVQAYFNRFKEAADEDLPGLLEDLQILDEQSKKGS